MYAVVIVFGLFMVFFVFASIWNALEKRAQVQEYERQAASSRTLLASMRDTWDEIRYYEDYVRYVPGSAVHMNRARVAARHVTEEDLPDDD